MTARCWLCVLAAALLATLLGTAAPAVAQTTEAPLEAAFDVPALVERLRALPDLPDGLKVLVWMDSTARADSVLIGDRRLLERHGPALRAAFRESSRGVAEARHATYGIDVSGGPGARVAARGVPEEVLPRVRNPGTLRSLLVRTAAENAHLFSDARPHWTAVVRGRVGADGRLSELAIQQPSGNELADARILQVVARAEVEPATLDGIPVPAWISIPIRLERQAARPSSTDDARRPSRP